jgi:hypothetical protein
VHFDAPAADRPYAHSIIASRTTRGGIRHESQ